MEASSINIVELQKKYPLVCRERFLCRICHHPASTFTPLTTDSAELFHFTCHFRWFICTLCPSDVTSFTINGYFTNLKYLNRHKKTGCHKNILTNTSLPDSNTALNESTTIVAENILSPDNFIPSTSLTSDSDLSPSISLSPVCLFSDCTPTQTSYFYAEHHNQNKTVYKPFLNSVRIMRIYAYACLY